MISLEQFAALAQRVAAPSAQSTQDYLTPDVTPKRKGRNGMKLDTAGTSLSKFAMRRHGLKVSWTSVDGQGSDS